MRTALPVRAAGVREGDLDTVLTVRLNSRKRARIDQVARRHGVAASDVARLALDEYLRGQTIKARRS